MNSICVRICPRILTKPLVFQQFDEARAGGAHQGAPNNIGLKATFDPNVVICVQINCRILTKPYVFQQFDGAHVGGHCRGHKMTLVLKLRLSNTLPESL